MNASILDNLLLIAISFSLSLLPYRDYTSPHTLRVEFGIAQEMEQMDRNFKVRQMLGEVSNGK